MRAQVEPSRWAGLRWALVLAVVAPMLVLAAALGTHAIIFPEGAALAMGVWVLGLPGWAVSRWRVAVLPPVCALAGVLLVRADRATWLAAIAATAIALVVLHACDSRLAPALSAAVLPVVFDVRAWSYPLAVLVISAVVAAAMPWLSLDPPQIVDAGRAGAEPGGCGGAPAGCILRVDPGPVWRRRSARIRAARCGGSRLRPSLRDTAGTGRYPVAIAGAGAALIAAWVLVGGELAGLSAAVLAPPLFVSALDWFGQPDACRAHEGLRRLALLVGAALAGSVAVATVPVAWLAGCLGVVVTLALMRAAATAHPPALAIALIPLILEPRSARDPLEYTLAIAAGAGALYLATYALSAVLARPVRVASA